MHGCFLRTLPTDPSEVVLNFEADNSPSPLLMHIIESISIANPSDEQSIISHHCKSYLISSSFRLDPSCTPRKTVGAQILDIQLAGSLKCNATHRLTSGYSRIGKLVFRVQRLEIVVGDLLSRRLLL